MSEFLFQYYPVHPTTWVYLSSLLMVGVYFKFSRFWSVRNIDLALLILLAPGLLMVHFGEQRKRQDSVRGEAVAGAIDPELAGDRKDDDEEATEEFSPAIDQVSGAVDETPSPPIIAAGIDSEGETDALLDAVASPEESMAETELATTVSHSTSQDSYLSGESIMRIGYIWLFSVLGIFLVRLLLDPTMVRRPLLEPNLSTGGLAFIGCSLFVFLMANVINSPEKVVDTTGAQSANQLLSGVADADLSRDLQRHGPGNAILHSIPRFVTTPFYWNDVQPINAHYVRARYVRTAKAMAIMSHLAIVVGIVAIGYQHFGSMKTGIGVATLYLLLPYTSIMTGDVDHVLPAALLIWAILTYRRPLAAGCFIGLAIGVAYYPIFLLPLWISFYWLRGLMRFISGAALTIGASILSLLFMPDGLAMFLGNVQKMFGIWWPKIDDLHGIWELGWDPTYRFPIIAASVAISIGFAIWPAQKNLGTLLSCSAAVLVSTQFWHGDGGGTYMAWFLPLTLLTIFRPNLEDRIALSVLGESWFRRRGPQLQRIDRAA